MKNKILFTLSIVITILIITHLVFIGISLESKIVLGHFANGNEYVLSKTNLIFFIGLLMIFSMTIINLNYIKEKKVNENLFLAYLILEIVLNILPYFNV